MKYHIALISHLILIVFAWSSPFIFDWRLVVLFAIGYSVLGQILKYCPLTKMQFGSKTTGFYEYYFHKFGSKLTSLQINMLSRFGFPAMIALLSIVWQVILKHPVRFALI